jgi:hypothetical protein
MATIRNTTIKIKRETHPSVSNQWEAGGASGDKAEAAGVAEAEPLSGRNMARVGTGESKVISELAMRFNLWNS